MAFDKTNRVPLFYQLYEGSITDVSEFTYMIDEATEYHYKNIGFILDRGYFSKGNIHYMDENHYSFIIMMKGCKTLVSSLIEENMHTFETSRECSIRAYRVYGKTVKGRLYDDDDRDRYFHLYFNALKQGPEREAIEQLVDSQKRTLESHYGKPVENERKYERYFTLHYDKNGNLSYFEEKADAIQKALNLCGYFCIISSEKMTAAEAIIQYKSRDYTEKLFQADKSFIGSESMRVQTTEAVAAKIFIEFIALIVRNRIYTLLKDTTIRLESKLNYMTVPAAIQELERIQLRQRDNGKYRLASAVTKKQKVILSAFGISEANVQEQATEIARLLQENRSLNSLNSDQEGGEHYGTDENDPID